MKNATTVYWTNVETSKGTYLIMATEKGVCWLGLSNTELKQGKMWLEEHTNVEKFIEDGNYPILKKAATSLKEYLAGDRKKFSLNYDLFITDFHKKVLTEMSKITYGKTKTYKELAVAVGRPQAARAIGAACRTNPVAIFIPCHRVIGSNGKLTGYAGGLSTKEWLLELEKVGKHAL